MAPFRSGPLRVTNSFCAGDRPISPYSNIWFTPLHGSHTWGMPKFPCRSRPMPSVLRVVASVVATVASRRHMFPQPTA